jgi:hypothetical protein
MLFSPGIFSAFAVLPPAVTNVVGCTDALRWTLNYY